MTRYRITRYEGESQPCAIADPAGCFYSTGEVDREMEEMKMLITDMLAWFKWYQPFPSMCVEDFIVRGSKCEGRSTDDGTLVRGEIPSGDGDSSTENGNAEEGYPEERV